MQSPRKHVSMMGCSKRKRDDEECEGVEVAAAQDMLLADTQAAEVEGERHFHAHDPLIVIKPKQRNKKAKTEVVKRVHKKSKEPVAVKENDQDDKQLIPQSPIARVRRYQIEVLDKALQRNTIVYLETGCGKTLIAVLLIKKLGHKLRDPNQKGIGVFLAPTVHLVLQQSEVLKINTDLKVESYFGAKGVDYWSGEMWQTEIAKNEVLVMTPQVFLDALRHSFMKMEDVELLILDECHHTQKHHAYAKIMREYYHPQAIKKPKIFGMTASPVIKKGVTSIIDCAEQMQRLELLLDAKVYTLKDRVELESYAPTPNQKTEFYDKPKHSIESVKQNLDLLKKKYQEQQCNRIQTNGDKSCFKDDEELEKKLRKRIRELHGSLDYCLQELGLWCAVKAAEILRKKDKKDSCLEVDIGALQNYKESFLKEALQVLEAALPEGNVELSNSVEDVAAAVKTGLLTPKVLLLVKCLMEYRNVMDMRCIVFVERVIGAMVLAKMANQIACLAFLKCDFLAGITASLEVMRPKQQQRAIDHFRAGKVNVLVATNVAEEGLDVQSCSSVIRFDLSTSVRSFIQSRGRARRPGSDYVIFLERKNQKQEDLLLDLIRSEESMRAQALNRTHHYVRDKMDPVEETDFYRVESTGATVNTDSSISFIYRFCSKLPGDKYYLPRPEFSFESLDGEDGLNVCKLTLPPNGPFRDLVGPPKRTALLAKQIVCLEACKKLHAMGQITDYLLPVIEAEKPEEEEEVMNLGGKKFSSAGTTKRKELHPTAATAALDGSWINSADGVLLQAYILSFTFTPEEDKSYSDFVFLVNAVIDEDVANTEIPLFLTRKRTAKAKLYAAGKFQLTGNQLKEAKAFHEVIFNGMFGKLIKRSKKADGGLTSNIKILLASSKKLENLWVPSCMYLLLPLIPCQVGQETQGIPIDWKTVKDSAGTARLFTVISSSQESGEYITDKKNELRQVTTIDANEEEEILHLASGSMPVSAVMDMAVITIHTGKVYTVMEVLQDKNADSAFPESRDSKASKYSSYTQYFKEKYGKVLNFPKQSLLQLKQTHRLHNLLTRHIDNSRDTDCTGKVKEVAFVEIPPELCLNLGVLSSVARSLYLVPSVMHRLNALLLGSQLRLKIAKDVPQCASIPAMQVMEALTTLRCLEGFSFEGLELLGDSFLKYAVSRYLFLVYDKKHEGQLSARRCRAICNATLHRLAAARDLPGYVRDEPFEPGHWVAPGMQCPKSVVCRCNLRNLSCLEVKGEGEEEKPTKVFKIGKTCNKGHRWMCSKTIADAVEALIGAYLVGGGSGSALGFMKWMGMDIEFHVSLIKDAMERPSVHPSILQGVNIIGLETQLDYVFRNKALLVEAITHASQQDPHGGCCYQRLEFLGDAVLDLLITRHLFSAHPGLTPGVLSDLRSAAVNNECFARSAVKHNMQRYLRHGSGALLSQITNFVKAVQMASEDGKDQLFGWEGVRGPKVLGDLVESIAGAILVDSGFDLDRVWTVMKPLLSPIVTPLTLPLHPIRELHELIHEKRFFFSWKKLEKDGRFTIATAEVELENELITGTARREHKKTAQKDAAQQVLLILEKRGIWHPRRQVSREFPTTDSTIFTSSDPKQEGAQVGEKRSFDGLELGSSDECDGKRLKLDFELNESENWKESGAIKVTSQLSEITERKEEGTMEVCMLNTKSSASRGDCFDNLEDKKRVKLLEGIMLEKNELGKTHFSGEHVLPSTSGRPSTHVDLRASVLLPQTPEVGDERLSKVEDEKDISSSEDSPALLESLKPSLNKHGCEVDDERFSKVEDEKDISSSENSPVLLESLKPSLDKHGCEDKNCSRCSSSNMDQSAGHALKNIAEDSCEGSVKNMSLEEGISPPKTVFLDGAFSLIRTCEQGCGRSKLYEFCSKQKWNEPVFELSKQDGVPHARWFTFSVVIYGHPKGPIKRTGQPMLSKKRAMDSAAVKMLLALKNAGLEVD